MKLLGFLRPLRLILSPPRASTQRLQPLDPQKQAMLDKLRRDRSRRNKQTSKQAGDAPDQQPGSQS